MYDRRERALRDQQWLLTSARQEGFEQGLKQSLEQGEIRLIQTLQEIFGLPVSDAATLRTLSPGQLRAMTERLRSSLQNRHSGTRPSTSGEGVEESKV